MTFLFRFCPLKLSLIIRSVGIRTRKATLPGRRRPFRIAGVLIFSMSRRRRTTTTTTFCFVLSLSAENKKHKDFSQSTKRRYLCWIKSHKIRKFQKLSNMAARLLRNKYPKSSKVRRPRVNDLLNFDKIDK